MNIMTKFDKWTIVDSRLAEHLEMEFGWIKSEAHLEECMTTIMGMVMLGKWDLRKLKPVFSIILWDLPVCLQLRKLLTLKYFRLMTAAFKIYHKGAPSEAKHQVKAGIAFIKSGTDIILQELPKYRAVLSSKKLIVNVVPLKIKRQAKRAIQA
jgi:hypothetical protein